MNINKKREIKLGSAAIGRDNPVFIIGEAGTSHNGDIVKAEEMIIAAAESGVDCVKFQYVIAEEIIHPKTGNVALPGGDIPLFQRFKNLEKDISFYQELKDITEKNNLIFLCSPFGIKSARNLKKIGVQGFKIASPELNHYPLLREIGKYPAILSTGVSTLGDIENALNFLPGDKAILHCITSYPAPEEEYNLKLISLLSDIFNIPVGISDHSQDPVLIPVLSTLMGSSIIEKHFTLEKNGDGLDDPIAVDPGELTVMCSEIRKSEKRQKEETREYLFERYGKSTISRIEGTGIKRLAPSETANYRTTNRSIIAIADIKKGELFSDRNIALLRSEKQLKPGLPPELFMEILKRKSGKDIETGTGINWDCF